MAGEIMSSYTEKTNDGLEFRTHPYYKFVQKLLELNSKDIFLDVGCGTADFCSALQKKEDVGMVIGLDMSRDNLREARKKNDKLQLVLGTIFNLPFKKSVVTKCSVLEILEHLGSGENVLRALKEIRLILGNEQNFIMTTPNRGRFFRYVFLDPVSWLGRHHHFSKEELSKLLTDANLKIEKMDTIGGPLFVMFFYVIYWRIRKWGLLKFRPIKSLFNFIIYRTELEFEKQNKDGCMFIVKAKKQELLKEENVASTSNKITNLWGCPKCKGGVARREMFLTCNFCQLAYPILDGNIPNMLIEEAWPLEKAEKRNFKHSLEL